MTKGCLECKKDYEAKRDTSKFCSDNCRVKWNQKNGRKVKGELKPFQMQVLYNQMVEINTKLMAQIENAGLPPLPEQAIQKIPNMRYVPVIPEKEVLAAYNASHQNQFTSVENIKSKSFNEFLDAIAELDTEYEYRMLAKEIDASPIPEKQKNLLHLNMKQPKMNR